jgi:cell fate regulator YaaT (PSP1 superfamily)
MNKSLALVNVRFFDQVQPVTCVIGDREVFYGQKVVALSDRGVAIGVVNSLPFYSPKNGQGQSYQKILKLAKDQDIEDCKIIYQKQRAAGIIFKDLIAQHGLDMSLDHFKFSSGGRKVLFYYRSAERVDFRELLKSLKQKISERVELHQLSSTDSSTSSERIGPCGMELCLFINSTFKDSKNNGPRCSKNKCCLDFKDPFYEDKFSRLPKKGDYIQTRTSEVGRVVKVDPVREEFELLTDLGVIKRYVSQMFIKKLDKNKVAFPVEFERVFNETKIVIGRDDLDSIEQASSKLQADEVNKRNKEFVENNFELLFGKPIDDCILPGNDD